MRIYAEALMRVTRGGFLFFTGRKGSEVSGLVISGLDRGADDGRVSAGGDVLVSGCDGWRKKMWPNTQSIVGLKQVSQRYPSTIVQEFHHVETSQRIRLGLRCLSLQMRHHAGSAIVVEWITANASCQT